MKHSKEYVIKIMNELNKTPDDVMRQVMEFTGSIVYGLNPFEYLRHFNAKDIRKILLLNNDTIQWLLKNRKEEKR